MAQANPFDQFDATPTGPLPGAPPKPDKPNEPPSGYQWGPNGTLIPIPGGPADKTNTPPTATEVEIAAKQEGAKKRQITVDALMGEVRKFYNEDIKGQPITRGFGFTEYFSSLPRNERFNAAANNILPLIRPLVAQSAKEGDSDKEMQVFQSYIPQSGDSDITIEQKLKGLEILIGGMVDGKLPSQVAPTLGSQNAPPPPPLMQGQTPASSGGNAPPQPGIPGAGGGGGQPMAPAQGGMRAVPDQNLANELFAMLNAGRSIDEISAYAQSKGAAPIIPNAETLDYARKNPGWNPFTATRYEPVTDFERTATAIGGSAPGAYAIGAGQFLSGNTLDNLQADPERARLSMDLAAQQSPTATAIGEVSGGVIGSLAGEAMLARLGAPGGVIRSFAADAGYGAANGAGMADNPGQNRGTNALFGAALAAGGSAAGRVAGQGVNSLARGVRDPATRQMMNEVGDLTVGQTYGQSGRVGAAVKGVEDRLSGLPVVGDSVNAARAKTVQNFNAKAFDKALEPIGQKLNGEVGQDAVANAQAKVQQAFRDALDGRSVQADASFANEMTQATTKVMAIRRVGPELSDQIADILSPHMQQGKNNLTGEEMQIISQELRNLKAAYKSKEPAFYKKIGEAIDSTENAVFGLFRRQAPDVVPKYNAAKQA
jgi:hypothetical protein